MYKSKTEDIDIKDVIRTIYRRWYIVLAMIILFLGFACYRGYFKTTTVYQARTNMIVGNPIDGQSIKYQISDVQLYERFVQTYCSLASTNYISEKVSAKLDNRISAEVIQNSVVIAAQPNTQFINLSIIWNNPEDAITILDTFSQVFISESRSIYPTCSIKEIEGVKKVKPIVISKRLYGVVSPIVGLVVGILIIFALEVLDNTIRTEKDVKEYLNNISVIGEIPKEKKLLEKINLESIKELNPLMIEAFRNLRTNIEFVTSCNSLKSIVITSTMPKEGKSFSTAMLASAIANTGKKTIIIDCDLRNPNMHKLFKLPNERGLTNYLAGKFMLTDVICKSNIEGLFIITSGTKPPNPTELLSSQNMKALMRTLRNEYDYIIIDTPPVGLVVDAGVLAQITDGTIFVISSGKSDRKKTIKAKEIIRQVGGNIIGVVLNNIKHSSAFKAYPYYYSSSNVKNRLTKKKINRINRGIEKESSVTT